MKSLKQYLLQKINENLYNGCEELSKHLLEIIKEKSTEKIIELNKSDLDFPNIFFETLYIFINPEKPKNNIKRKSKEYKKSNKRKISESTGAGYEILDTDDKDIIANSVKWNNETKMFNYIILNIYFDNKTELNHKILGHELNHAYEDYQIRLSSEGDKTLDDYIYSYYDNARNLISTNDRTKQIVGYIEYISTGIEIRSFCKQALLHFKENIHKYNNIDDAIEKQSENNDVFQEFFKFKNLFDLDKSFKTSRQNIINAYKEVHKHDKDYLNESDNKIIKRLENHLNKFYNALVKELKTYYKNIMNNLYKNFVNGIAWSIFDINLLCNDLEFEHLIGFDNSLKIRNMIYEDIFNQYDNRINEIINETIQYEFKGEFFNVLKIEFEHIDELFHNYTIMNEDVCVVNFDNIKKILTIHIKCHHPLIIDFVLIKLALLIGYYQYLTQNNIDNEFVDFMNYIISNNKNRLSNSTNIFESAFNEIYEIRKNKVHFGLT